MTTASTPRRLYRSRDDRMIAGVCGGVAQHFGWDPTLVRLVVALSVLLPGPQFIAYVIAWIVIPEAPVVAPYAPAPAEPPTSPPQ